MTPARRVRLLRTRRQLKQRFKLSALSGSHAEHARFDQVSEAVPRAKVSDFVGIGA
jgi:hypothetical protein